MQKHIQSEDSRTDRHTHKDTQTSDYMPSLYITLQLMTQWENIPEGCCDQQRSGALPKFQSKRRSLELIESILMFALLLTQRGVIQLVSRARTHLDFHVFSFEQIETRSALPLYLGDARQRRRRRRRLPRGELSHPWQRAGHPKRQTRPGGRTRCWGPGWGGAVLMGVGPLANPGRAGKGAELEAAAITRNTKKQKKRRQKYLGDLQAQAYFTGIDREEEKRKEKKGTNCCDVHERRHVKVEGVAL